MTGDEPPSKTIAGRINDQDTLTPITPDVDLHMDLYIHYQATGQLPVPQTKSPNPHKSSHTTKTAEHSDELLLHIGALFQQSITHTAMTYHQHHHHLDATTEPLDPPDQNASSVPSQPSSTARTLEIPAPTPWSDEHFVILDTIHESIRRWVEKDLTSQGNTDLSMP